MWYFKKRHQFLILPQSSVSGEKKFSDCAWIKGVLHFSNLAYHGQNQSIGNENFLSGLFQHNKGANTDFCDRNLQNQQIHRNIDALYFYVPRFSFQLICLSSHNSNCGRTSTNRQKCSELWHRVSYDSSRLKYFGQAFKIEQIVFCLDRVS